LLNRVSTTTIKTCIAPYGAWVQCAYLPQAFRPGLRCFAPAALMRRSPQSQSYSFKWTVLLLFSRSYLYPCL